MDQDTAVAPDEDELERRRVESADAAMREQGISTETPVQADYFGFEEYEDVHLPDGISTITIQALNEGARRKYQNTLNRDVTIKKNSGDATMRIAAGQEKKELLTASIVDWNLKRTREGKRENVPFKTSNLNDFLDKAPPRIIDLIEKAIRKLNPWLQSEMSLADIDQEIANLQEIRDQKVKEEEGK